jgi:hypothetical protein
MQWLGYKSIVACQFFKIYLTSGGFYFVFDMTFLAMFSLSYQIIRKVVFSFYIFNAVIIHPLLKIYLNFLHLFFSRSQFSSHLISFLQIIHPLLQLYLLWADHSWGLGWLCHVLVLCGFRVFGPPLFSKNRTRLSFSSSLSTERTS